MFESRELKDPAMTEKTHTPTSMSTTINPRSNVFVGVISP
jgi:hypothetical protein